jgi:hypothetical protein
LGHPRLAPQRRGGGVGVEAGALPTRLPARARRSPLPNGELRPVKPSRKAVKPSGDER